MGDCLENCIYQRRTIVTSVEISTPRSSASPETCKFTDAVQAVVTQKVRDEYQKTENGKCSGNCHCVKAGEEEKPVKDAQEFDTEVKIDNCTYKVHGVYRTETYDTPGKCIRNGGTIKISTAQIPDSDITIILENYDNVSGETLAQIGQILRRSRKTEG
jgi:hypothetical protein